MRSRRPHRLTGKEKNLTQLEDGSYAQMAKVSVTVSEEYKKAFEVLELVNKERKKAGADPLVMDQGLLETAMKRGAETVIYWSHTDPAARAASLQTAAWQGENIALGNSTAESVMESWMNSPDIKPIFLARGYKSIGIGCVKCMAVISGYSVLDGKQELPFQLNLIKMSKRRQSSGKPGERIFYAAHRCFQEIPEKGRQPACCFQVEKRLLYHDPECLHSESTDQ